MTLNIFGEDSSRVCKYLHDPLAIILAGHRTDADMYCGDTTQSVLITQEITTSNYKHAQVQVLDEHMIVAKKIRLYYQNKLTLQFLNGNAPSLTPFRQDLLNLLSGDPLSLREDQKPMLAVLPRFYKEDIYQDRLQKNFTMVNSDVFETPERMHNHREEWKLVTPDEPYQIRMTKKERVRVYWYYNAKNELLKIPISLKNPLAPLFEKCTNTPTVTFTGDYYADCMMGRNLTYWSMDNWNIEL